MKYPNGLIQVFNGLSINDIHGNLKVHNSLVFSCKLENFSRNQISVGASGLLII